MSRVDLGARLLAVMPQPADLTPADTSSTVAPALAAALRRHHEPVTEIVVECEPSTSEIDSVIAAAADHGAVVVGTINAGAGPGAMVDRLLATERPVITLALRDPFDLRLYARAPVHLATYSIHSVSLEAAADVIFGGARPQGRPPVAIPGLHERGHGHE